MARLYVRSVRRSRSARTSQGDAAAREADAAVPMWIQATPWSGRISIMRRELSARFFQGPCLPRDVSAPCGVGQRITLCDRDLELRRLHCVIEVLEFADPGNGVISSQCDTASLPWRWLDAVWVSHLSVWPKCIEALPERVAAGESEHGINSLGRKARARLSMSTTRLPSTTASAPISRTSSTPLFRKP